MSKAEAEVLAFFEEWKTVEENLAGIRRRFTPQTVWDNVGVAKLTGIDEAIAFSEGFFKQFDVGRGEVILHHIASVGEVVLTERTDNFYDTKGKLVFSVKLMGILEMDGPKILGWRDYFDTKGLGG